ncbi:hypothetical protein Desca_1335 [Desulfotomaculum nigrificans CO-1-SRB]|uniref:Uncharacterized protein n=1 Tax=Desulfotomaculum nigrificans (strain DSM 14880 / VKM B-2319 / CO-1-SRB) TaxID=868595 RepID=F6B4T2_DESCC|nr:hypothetical protein [Desulfotomaculum nigrificans]AEF94194.1 hypothetical protein Desca_1335 [Desulfotomaculum nigrificans CO-1-SRB]
MGINLAEVSSALKLLEETLGAKMIKAEVHKIDGWNPEGAPGLHPLVLLWYKCREDLAMASLTGTSPNSRWVQELLSLAGLLQSAAVHPRYQQAVVKLRYKESVQEGINQLKELRLDE